MMRDIVLRPVPGRKDNVCEVNTLRYGNTLRCPYKGEADCTTLCALFDTETAEGETFATCKGYFLGRLDAPVAADPSAQFDEGLDAAARYLEAMTTDDLFVDRVMHAKRIRNLGR
jgi:hypothetical protein